MQRGRVDSLKPEEISLYFCWLRKEYRDDPCDALDPKHEECFKVSDLLPAEEEE